MMPVTTYYKYNQKIMKNIFLEQLRVKLKIKTKQGLKQT